MHDKCALVVALIADFEPGGFPLLLDQFSRDSGWNTTMRFSLAGTRKTNSEAQLHYCTLTFEADPGAVERILAQPTGVQWRANQLVAGIGVNITQVERAIDFSPLDANSFDNLGQDLEFAFRLNDDLDSFGWFQPEREP
ncbi:MAG: hypothetical protein GY716_17760 [bacterium]|nr:hypothetical protein [bacterium]